MKTFISVSLLILILCNLHPAHSQDNSIHPSLISTGRFLGETPPLRDLPAISQAEWNQMVAQAELKERNAELETRSYPFAASALPKGQDPVWQRSMGVRSGSRAPVLNFQSQTSPYFPPDCNGTVGLNHYMQTINTTYAIYNKSGALVAGPTNMNLLFNGVTGSSCNDGDPIVLYDEQASRWFAGEFSICGNNDYMLIAVSTTNDPTGTWYAYSFDVADMPDYEKFGIWRDGYYMGTNNSSGNDIYVFERSQMLNGLTAQMVAFNNAWRPTTIDGFMCVPPVDNDGTFAPTSAPGLFITINDDAIGGGTDQLWIYELAVNWTTPASSTFTRTQQLNVAAFDSNFGTDWDNIAQPGTSRQLDAIPQVIMNVPQYRNFGTYQTIVCCHTVDVDNSDHAGIRWYELRKTTGSWSIRQQGTYAPDGHSRWMGSIMLNGSDQLGLGYSVSSSTVYPGIRYCGQTSVDYAAATGIMDQAEDVIMTGANSQTAYNRWGDYSCVQVDPSNDSTFWFTTEYIGSGGSRLTRIASFNLGPEILDANFSADLPNPNINTTVVFTDQSTGDPVSWSWSITPASYSYVDGTSSSSQNPHVQFSAAGSYTVSLTISDGQANDTETKPNYINAFDCSSISLPFAEDFSDGFLPACWTIADHQGNGQVWSFNNPGGRTINSSSGANGFAIIDSDVFGSGNTQNADLVSPALDLFNYSSVTLSFQHYFLQYTGTSAKLSFSIDGGNTWTALQTWTTTTANAETYSQDVSTQVAGQSNVKFKWNYTGTYGWYWAVDDISITGTQAGIWTGGTSGDWTTPANWIDNAVPGNTINITVPASAPNWPVLSSSLTLGTTCKNLILEGGTQMTVNGNLTIPLGYSLTFEGSGLAVVGGNWTNKGTFVPASGTVEFTGSTSSSTISGWTTSDLIVTNYSRTTFPKGMTALTDATSGPSGDDASADIPIGFAFKYLNNSYTQAEICTNGWLSFNLSSLTTNANGNLFTSTVPNLTLAPWFDNLNSDATSLISYKTTGNEPNRVFTVEWRRVLTFRNTATARISFQVKLYETTNVIEFHYGNLESGTHNASESASMGIEDATGGNGHFIEATTGSTTTGISNLVSTTNWPTANYRFTPPSLELNFNNVTVNNPGGSINFNINTSINTNFNVMPGGSFRVNSGKVMKVNGTPMK